MLNDGNFALFSQRGCRWSTQEKNEELEVFLVMAILEKNQRLRLPAEYVVRGVIAFLST